MVVSSPANCARTATPDDVVALEMGDAWPRWVSGCHANDPDALTLRGNASLYAAVVRQEESCGQVAPWSPQTGSVTMLENRPHGPANSSAASGEVGAAVHVHIDRKS